MTKFTYSLVFVRDMAKSIAFYRDLMGLPLRSETPFWTSVVEGLGALVAKARSRGRPRLRHFVPNLAL